MSLYDIFVTLAIGAISGWIAGIIMGSKGNIIRNIIIVLNPKSWTSYYLLIFQ